MTYYFFRQRKHSFSDPNRWYIVRKVFYDRNKRIEDLWLTKETDLFGDVSLKLPEGFLEISPSLFEFEGTLKHAEEKFKEMGFISKGVLS